MTDWPNCSDSELAKRCRSILLQMKMLSEGPASSALRGIDKISGYEDPSKPPRWTGSLFEEWLPKFAAADGDDKQLESCCMRAEADLARTLGKYRAEHKLPSARNEIIDGRMVVNDDDALRKVVEIFAGRAPVEVAHELAGQVGPEYIEKARRKYRCDPRTGHPLEGWRGWDEERRKKEVGKRWNRGMRIELAAEEISVSRQTLQKYWPGRQAA